MKSITVVILFICFCSYKVYCQATIEIVYQPGVLIEIQTGADVCANTITLTGSFTGEGTFCSGPLPVTLSSFSAVSNANNVMLVWRTEAELNNSGFDIERMNTAVTSSWEKISFVAGNGTVNEPRNYSYADRKLQKGIYKYRLKQIDYNGGFEYFDLYDAVTINSPGKLAVSQNYPNPSNPKSKIDYEIPAAAKVTIRVYDILGREVSKIVDEYKEAGYYSAEFDGTNLSSGVYYYMLTAGEYSGTKKMILVK